MKKRIALIALAAAASCLVATSALAGGETGEGWINAKNTPNQMVMISGSIFHIGPQTQMRGFDEERLTLESLGKIPEVENLGAAEAKRAVFVEYKATDLGERRVLDWIRLEITEGMDWHQLPESHRRAVERAVRGNR